MDQKSSRVESGTHDLDKRLNGEQEDQPRDGKTTWMTLSKVKKTEAIRSNDLENKNRWLVTTMNINEWEKKERQHAQHVIDD